MPTSCWKSRRRLPKNRRRTERTRHVSCRFRRGPRRPCTIWRERYVEFLGDDPPPWRDVCYTAAVRRDHHDCRLAVLARTPAEARELLYNYIEGAASLDGSPRPGVFSGRKPYGRSLKIAFVYDEPAGTWKSCGAGLVRSLPGFASTLESIDDTIQGILGWRLATIFKADGASNGRNHAQSALLALQLALTAWWRSAGVTPDVVRRIRRRGVGSRVRCGHSHRRRRPALGCRQRARGGRSAIGIPAPPCLVAVPFVASMARHTPVPILARPTGKRVSANR